jgi:predicted DNA-binding transcriptional regulator AlpA
MAGHVNAGSTAGIADPGRNSAGGGMPNAILTEAEREYAVRLAREMPAVIEIEDLPKWIGMSRATIYRLRQRNRFPIRPLSPTTRRVQFAGIDVLRYLLRSRE